MQGRQGLGFMKKSAMENPETVDPELDNEEEEEEEDQDEDWGDWEAEDVQEEESDLDILCLFCDANYSSCDALFQHCSSIHHFDFFTIRESLSLDFYGSFKLINFVRSRVAENTCWSCGFCCQSNKDLQSHLHEAVNFEEIKLILDDDKYLNPFMPEDPLLYSFAQEEGGEDGDDAASLEKEEILRDLIEFGKICIDDGSITDANLSKLDASNEDGREGASTSNGYSSMGNISEKKMGTCTIEKEPVDSFRGKAKDKHLRVSFANVISREIKNANENYFGAYSSFGIHREMISDKVRMDAYRQAILSNPSLMSGATVLDVGCGTGILSLFAAQAGASRVIAVEASKKMASVATQVAKDNDLLWSANPNIGNNHHTGVIKVVHGMVEELDKSIEPHSVDVLLSEWMGYCLLYESMLSSVLFARDHWLKPGGAILPDTATIFVAGFGRGGTSIPFWENVYGFNMSCVGKEVVEDAAQTPIVDIVDSHDVVTDTAILQTFDLVTMKSEEMDFTASITLQPKLDGPAITNTSMDWEQKPTWCHGVVLWFETGFTSRFCRETPAILSTSPFTPKTHWSQTILTFREPIAMAAGKPNGGKSVGVGTDACPVSSIHVRISITRAAQHRSIDISLETSGIACDGRKHSWPVQIFNLG